VHLSQLYERLSLGIADDPELLAIADQAKSGQPVPNLFLGAVHFLLLGGVQHPLGHFSGRMACGDDARGIGSQPDRCS
jgi:hypothetical protein